MGFLMDATIALPIGIIYNMIVHECANIFNEKSNYKEKLQRGLLIIFGGGLIGFLVAHFLTVNRSLRFGMYLGALLLIGHTVMYNWETMRNDTRIIIMILSLGVLIWYSYTQSLSDQKKDNKKKKPKKNKEIEEKTTTDETTDYEEDDGMKLSSLLPMNLPRFEHMKEKQKL